jgi:hypothetical protein
MKNTIAVLMLAAAALLSNSCKKESEAAPENAAPNATAAAQHAPAHAQPGSHEDWCAEHQVPESLCSRCNPSLIAAFKATGDWCAEHGLPESQCLACNPNLKIERPPQKGP